LNMQNNLKSLQYKIMDLESKLNKVNIIDDNTQSILVSNADDISIESKKQ
jgi:hypothetical protein